MLIKLARLNGALQANLMLLYKHNVSSKAIVKTYMNKTPQLKEIGRMLIQIQFISKEGAGRAGCRQ